MKDKIFLEFKKMKRCGTLIFMGEDAATKIGIENRNVINNNLLLSRKRGIIGDYHRGVVNYSYDASRTCIVMGRWFDGWRDLSLEEASAILSHTHNDGLKYVRWAKYYLGIGENHFGDAIAYCVAGLFEHKK